jgi:class 3 adenylate cyclase
MAGLPYFSTGLGVLKSNQEMEFQYRQMDLYSPRFKLALILVSLCTWMFYLITRYKTIQSPNVGLYFGLFQGWIVFNYILLDARNRWRLFANYMTPVFPVFILYIFMALYAPYLPNKGMILQTQVVPVLVIIASYALEKLSPVYAILTGLVSSLFFLYLRAKIPAFAELPNWQIITQLSLANGLGVFISLDQGMIARTQFKLEKDIERKKRVADKLIARVFPAQVARELKATGSNMARDYKNVTIMFADIVNYTKISSGLPPKQLVAMLHELFNQFDRLADHYGVEKIKTIGDAYMAASGCPQSAPDHAQRIARFSLALIKQVAKFNQKFGTDLNIRIGIHSGPVIAGVITGKRISFDMWGDAVNVASRVQTNADPGEILVSEKTAELLQREFSLSDLRFAELKGLGLTKVRQLVCEVRSPKHSLKSLSQQSGLYHPKVALKVAV